MKKMVSLCFSLLMSANLAFSAQYYCESSGFVGTFTPGGRGCEKWKNSWGENQRKNIKIASSLTKKPKMLSKAANVSELS